MMSTKSPDRVVMLGFVFATAMLHLAFAEEPVQPPLFSLEEALSVTLSNNPALHAAEFRENAAATLPAQAHALPDPTFVYKYDVANGLETSYEWEQSVPGSGKRRLRTGLAEDDARLATWELAATRIELITHVTDSYFRLHGLQLSLDAISNQEAILERMETSARTRYGSGSTDQGDVLKASSERTMLKQKRLLMEQDVAQWLAHLNEAMARPPLNPIGRTSTEPTLNVNLNLEPLQAWTYEHNPELQQLKVLAERADQEWQLAKKEQAPDWKLGAEYRDQADADSMVLVSVGVDLPVWHGRNQARIRKAQYERESAQDEVDAMERHLIAEIQSIGLCCTRIEESVKLYRTELIPQAEQRFEASRAAYEAGRGDFLDLLESERFLLDVRIMSATAEADLGMKVARLETALGSPLEEVRAGGNDK